MKDHFLTALIWGIKSASNMKGIALSFLLFCISLPSHAAWRTRTVDAPGNGMSPSLAVDSSNRPHISYYDYTNKDLKYAKWNGTSWETTTVDSAGDVGSYSSIALDAAGYPHISYNEHLGSLDHLKHAKWNGSSWEIETVDATDWVGSYNSIAIDGGGNPHISYFDEMNMDVKYAKFNGTAWEISTPVSFANHGPTSIAVDGSGNPHITYCYNDGYIHYIKKVGASWQAQTPDIGYPHKLVLDGSGNPRIGYISEGGVAIKYAAWTGATWSTKTVDSAAINLSLSLDSSGNPHFSYINNSTDKDLKYAFWNGTAWVIQTLVSDVDVYFGTSIKIDSLDKQHISYRDQTNGILKHKDFEYPPDAISDLAVVSPASNSMYLSWSSPGEDGQLGVLYNSTFTIQYSSSPADASNPLFWSTTAAQVAISTTGITPGTQRYFQVTGLLSNTTYYFRVWTKDAFSNYAPLSNGATALTLLEAPTSIFFDEISTTAITASAYAPSGFSRLEVGLSGVVVAKDNTYSDWRNGNIWTEKALMPTGRYYFGGATYNGKIYAIGGQSSGVTFTKNEEYDPVLDIWSTKTQMPLGRHSLSTVYLDGKIYAIGGLNQAGNYQDINHSYDPVSDAWTTTNAVMPSRSSSLAAVALRGRLYAFGGLDGGPSNLNLNVSYSPATDSWATHTNLPTARYSHVAVTVNGKIYVIGGQDTGGYSSKNEEYNPALGSWATKTALPTPRNALAAAMVGGKIYVIGGERTVDLDVNEEYDPISDTWKTRAPMPTARQHHIAVALGGKIYAIGGMDAIRKTEVYDPGVTQVYTSLTPNTRYTFKAKGRNSAGIETTESVEISTYTLALAPAAAAAPITAVNISSVTVAWLANGNPSSTLYKAQASTSDSFASIAASSETYNLTAAIAGLAPNTTYYLRVVAVNGDNIYTDYLALGSTITLAAVPTNTAVSGITTTQFAISWVANGNPAGTTYQAQISTNNFSSVFSSSNTLTTSATFYTLTPNASHKIRIRAVSSAGNWSSYTTHSATPTWTLANPPTGTSTSVLYVTSATINWALNSNTPGTTAEVQRSTITGTFSGATTATTTVHTATELLSCTTYYFRVRNINGADIPTSYDSALTLYVHGAGPAYPPSNLSALSQPGNTIQLTWDPSPSENVATYHIFFDSGTGTINYSDPLAVLPSTATSYTTEVLLSSASYRFALRAYTACGGPELNTNVLASAAAMAATTGVKAAIKIPQAGKRVNGNRVTIMAEPVLGESSQIRQILFQYKASTDTAWQNIVSANINHANPDDSAPYLVHWDVTALYPTNYDLRAVASDLNSNPDATPSAITIAVDTTDPDINENSQGGGALKKEQKVNNAIANTVQAADEGTGHVIRVELPSGALNTSTVTLSVTNSPTSAPTLPAGVDSAGVVAEITLSNAQTLLSSGKSAVLTLYYPDENNDGIVDGTTVRADTLEMYSAETLAGPWTRDLNSSVNYSSKTVVGQTTHFSFFALFAPLASNLSAIEVYPIPFRPNDGNSDTGTAYSAGNPNSGIIFDNLPANVSIKIFSLTGQLVAKFSSASSSGKLQWDVKTESGSDVASGGYFAVISSPGQKSVTKKLLVIR